MSQANLLARLVGGLFVQARRHSFPPGQLDALVQAMWREAAGDQVPIDDQLSILPVLDGAGLIRLRRLISERFAFEIAGGLLVDLDGVGMSHHGQSGQSAAANLQPVTQGAQFTELLAETAERLSILPDKPEETAETTLRALWLAAVGSPVSADQAAETNLPMLSDVELARLRALLTDRFSGIPLAHLTGRQRFMGFELMTSKAALVPRKETELLGFAAAAMLRQIVDREESATVIDVCTGAGNLALVLATCEPVAKVYASDLSGDAVELARRNGKMLNLQDRVEFRQGDFLEPFADGHFDHQVDLLVCNPPYISSGKVGTMPAEIIGYEPSLAFDGGPFGVKILQRLITEAPQYLRKGGWLAFEVGHGQGKAIMDRLRRNREYVDMAGIVDSAGVVRAVVAQVA